VKLLFGFVTPEKPSDHGNFQVPGHTSQVRWLNIDSGRVCECCGSDVVTNADLMNASNQGFTMGIDIEQEDLKAAIEGDFLYDHVKLGDHVLTLKLRDRDDRL
jgi:hypothetical protein